MRLGKGLPKLSFTIPASFLQEGVMELSSTILSISSSFTITLFFRSTFLILSGIS